MLATILAHQGGWDEMLMVAGPIGLFAYIIRRANQRAERLAAEQSGAGDAETPAPSLDGGDVGTE